MIFAETERLFLRKLEREELPRLVHLIGAWEVTRWLTVVPFPYTLRDAEEFYDSISPHEAPNEPQFFTLALKTDNALIGGIGLHAPRTAEPQQGETEIGYWLGRDYWGRGLMIEAAQTVIAMGFNNPDTLSISATTDPANLASQKILTAAGLTNMGLQPRTYAALRGSDQIHFWQLTREDYEESKQYELYRRHASAS
jgi:RimJ/RimL family protein N-acetyltransferase